VRALTVAGLGDLALADAWTFRRFQLPNGAFVSQRGQLDGTGEALWAFEQAASIPPSSERARRFLPYVRRGVAWIEAQRAATRRLGAAFRGMLPYGEPRDNELIRANIVGNDAWSLAGEEEAASLAARAGDRALADSIRAAHADYREAFLGYLSRVRHADVPPSWQGAGRDWGNLGVVYPTRVLPPEDARVQALARRVWQRAGGPGLVCYGPADSLHSYLGGDLAQAAILAGRPADARAVLTAMLSHSSSTLGQAEIFSRADGGFGTNLPPHSTAAATLVDLVRNMIVSDARDTLEIGPGTPLQWWAGLRFQRAPTRFGVVDVALDQPAPDRLRASWTAVGAPVRVRVPDGTRVVAVMTPEARWGGGALIECPAGSHRVELRIAGMP
jgi:hypothetical protein